MGDEALNWCKGTSFGSCDNNWLPKISLHLPSKEMIHVSRCWRIGKREIGIIDILPKIWLFQPESGRSLIERFEVQITKAAFGVGHLQKPFNPAAGMFRPHTIIPMRENERQSWLSKPFVFWVGEKDVYHHLSSVVEISELGFPNREVVGMVKSIAIFKGHHSVFTEGGVEDFNVASTWSLLREELKRVESVFAFLIDEVEMALWKGASFNVLSRETNVVALKVERKKSQCLASGPIQLILIQGIQPFLDMILLDSGMHLEIGWRETTSLSELF